MHAKQSEAALGNHLEVLSRCLVIGTTVFFVMRIIGLCSARIYARCRSSRRHGDAFVGIHIAACRRPKLRGRELNV